MGQDLKGNSDKQNPGDNANRSVEDDMSSHQPVDGLAENGKRGVSRRDVAKAGVSAPLLMSLFSRPAWGGGICSVSALASGNASGRHDDDDCTGYGCTPGFWKNNLLAWQGTGFSPGTQVFRDGKPTKEWTTDGATPFSAVFGFAPAIGDDFTTMLDVMLEHELEGALGTYENHLVAAVLNAASSSLYGSTVIQIVEVAKAVHYGTEYQGRYITQSEFMAVLVNMNESGECFLNAKGECAPGFVEHEGTCVPSCKRGERFDMNSMSCVLLDDWDETCRGVED